MLAGISAEYYVRLERGNVRGVSEDVLDGIARALQLDDAEYSHLLDLARVAREGARPVRRRMPAKQVRPSLQHMLDAMTSAAAFISNGRLDIVANNALARGLQADVFDTQTQPPNLARYCFLDPSARDFYPDWEAAADTTVTLLRTEAGRDPHHRALTDLVGELATRSDAFRTRWAAHDVRIHHNGAKQFHHPVVGTLALGYCTLDLPAEDAADLRLTIYTAEPGSPSEDGLKLLASWAATARDPAAPAADVT